MKTEKLLKEMQGVQTIQSVKVNLGIDKKKAIYYIHRLRKKGYVKTQRMGKTRVYYISYQNKFNGIGYYDILNKYAPIKLAHNTHKIYGRKITLEETLIFAIKTKSIRAIIASLALFKKINNWSLLYKLAKQNNLRREVGALYDVARTIIKTRRMPKRFKNNSLSKGKKRYIVQGSRSKHFQDIENKWKVYIPLNKADLEEYK